MKYFMYAQNVRAYNYITKLIVTLVQFPMQSSTLRFFLIEANMSKENRMFSFILKCDNPKQAAIFTKYFLQSLVSQPNST